MKYLGVQIDSQLSWKEHITVALSKISRGVGMQKYSKKFLSLETVQKMYLGVVIHILDIVARSGVALEIQSYKSSKRYIIELLASFLLTKHHCP